MPNDQFDKCFLKITPPSNLTFSKRNTPCRFEPPSYGYEVRKTCPFSGPDQLCEKVMRSALPQAISRAYTERIKNTLSETSTSIVVRSEQQFHANDMCRTTQRRHLYEALKTGTAEWSRFGIGCTKLDSDDRLGEYIGFLELREHFHKSPLAFAILVEPGSIREDPSAFIIRGDYGPLFGAHSFRGTVYAMQDPMTAGAMCAQTCIIMALGMLGDRKSEIKGSFTITYLGQLIRMAAKRNISVERLEREIEDTKQSSPLSTFRVGGLSPSVSRDVLQLCNVGAALITINHEPQIGTNCSSSIRHALRVIEANIRARFPVILAVESESWKGDAECPDKDKIGHAVTIVGLRYNPRGEVTRVVAHDPASQPFLESSAAWCFNSAQKMPVQREGVKQAGGKYFMVVATEKTIRFHAHECVEWLLTSVIERPHFRQFYLCLKGTDYRILLSNSQTALRVLSPDMARNATLKWFSRAVFKGVDRVWCVVGYEHGEMHTAWIFDALSLNGKNYVLKLSRSGAGLKASVIDENGKVRTCTL